VIEVPSASWHTLCAALPKEQAYAIVPAHVLATGVGLIWVDDPDRAGALGVVTEYESRGRGLSRACAAALIEDVRGRRRMPCWGTTPDNEASLRVARKLGFRRLPDAMHFGAGAPLSGSRPLD